jgi:hypothetical protein
LAHPTKISIREVRVVRDEGKHARSGLIDAPLPKSNELHIIIVEPLWVPFRKGLPVDEEVVVNERPDPCPLPGSTTRILRVDDDTVRRIRGMP